MRTVDCDPRGMAERQRSRVCCVERKRRWRGGMRAASCAALEPWLPGGGAESSPARRLMPVSHLTTPHLLHKPWYVSDSKVGWCADKGGQHCQVYGGIRGDCSLRIFHTAVRTAEDDALD